LTHSALGANDVSIVVHELTTVLRKVTFTNIRKSEKFFESANFHRFIYASENFRTSFDIDEGRRFHDRAPPASDLFMRFPSPLAIFPPLSPPAPPPPPASRWRPTRRRAWLSSIPVPSFFFFFPSAHTFLYLSLLLANMLSWKSERGRRRSPRQPLSPSARACQRQRRLRLRRQRWLDLPRQS